MWLRNENSAKESTVVFKLDVKAKPRKQWLHHVASAILEWTFDTHTRGLTVVCVLLHVHSTE